MFKAIARSGLSAGEVRVVHQAVGGGRLAVVIGWAWARGWGTGHGQWRANIVSRRWTRLGAWLGAGGGRHVGRDRAGGTISRRLANLPREKGSATTAATIRGVASALL